MKAELTEVTQTTHRMVGGVLEVFPVVTPAL